MTDLRDILRSAAMYPRAGLDPSVLAERATRRRRRRATVVVSTGTMVIATLLAVISVAAARGDSGSSGRVKTFTGAPATSDDTTTTFDGSTVSSAGKSVPESTPSLSSAPTTAFATPGTMIVPGVTADTTDPSATTQPTVTTEPTATTQPTTTTVSPPPPISGTGVVGRVTAGPTCPVEPAPGGCPPNPVADTAVQAVDASGTVVGSDTTDSNGDFGITIAPGDYTLHVATSGPFPRCTDAQVTVTSGDAAQQDIGCDTGIR